MLKVTLYVSPTDKLDEIELRAVTRRRLSQAARDTADVTVKKHSRIAPGNVLCTIDGGKLEA